MILSTSQDAQGGRPAPRPTLAHVPGITITPERPETAPTAPIIRANRRKVSPGGVAIVAAAQRRLGWVRDALEEAREAGG